MGQAHVEFGFTEFFNNLMLFLDVHKQHCIIHYVDSPLEEFQN